MQASVHTFEPDGSGTVLLDSGVIHPFTADVFAASSLRLLRVGQRLSVEMGQPGRTTAQHDGGMKDAAVLRLWIVGIGEGQSIL